MIYSKLLEYFNSRFPNTQIEYDTLFTSDILINGRVYNFVLLAKDTVNGLYVTGKIKHESEDSMPNFSPHFLDIGDPDLITKIEAHISEALYDLANFTKR